MARTTARLWAAHHLTYDDSREVAKLARRALELARPAHRDVIVERLGEDDAARFVATAYRAAGARGLLVKTLLLTGARVAEFVALRVDDVRVAAAQIVIRQGKGDRSRIVPILPALAHELRTHIGARRAGWLFETRSAGRFSPRRVQQIVREVAAAAGITQRVYPHLLRHTVAQVLLERGMPLDQVQAFLGHASIETTQIYAAATPAMIRGSYERALTGGRAAPWSGPELGTAAAREVAPFPAAFAPGRGGGRVARAAARDSEARPGSAARRQPARGRTAGAARARTSASRAAARATRPPPR